jgi:hypothetical protein
VELLHGTWGGRKGKENDRVSTILKYITCEFRGNKNMY